MKYSAVNFYDGRFYFGYMVELFFVISGFVAMNSLSHKHTINLELSFKKSVVYEFIHKALRIYPMAIIACLFQLLVACCYKNILGSWPGHTNYGSARVILESLLLVFKGWPKLELHGINNPMWYLCVLLLCYIVFYISNYICRKIKINYVIFVLIAYVFIEFGRFIPVLNRIFCGGANRGYESFFLGVLLSMLIPHMRKKQIAIAAVVLLSAGCGMMILNMDLQRIAFLWLISPGLVMIACLFERIRVPIWNKLAAISFEMYVWHVPTFILLQLVNDGLRLNMEYDLTIMILLLIYILLFSTAMYYLVERNVNSMIKERWSRYEKSQSTEMYNHV